MKTKPLILMILCLVGLEAAGQSNSLRDFRDSNDPALSLFFYASTLRMLNLENNEEFDKLVKEIKKLSYFNYDSGLVSNDNIRVLKNALANEQFEEVGSLWSKEREISVYLKENGRKTPNLVIISHAGHTYDIVEVLGMVNISKLPGLMDSFSQDSFIDVLNLKNN